MYTRNYYPENDNISIPENYDGNAFIENKTEVDKKAGEELAEKRFSPFFENSAEECMKYDEPENAKGATGIGVISTFFQKLPISNIFDKFNFFKGQKFDFGTEEILIIGIALFLIFSKGGDIECAVMLLLLLLIK